MPILPILGRQPHSGVGLRVRQQRLAGHADAVVVGAAARAVEQAALHADQPAVQALRLLGAGHHARLPN